MQSGVSKNDPSYYKIVNKLIFTFYDIKVIFQTNKTLEF
jgi:hypothetical protein